MKPKHILILGGYGSTGLPLARLLIENTDVLISLAGRNLEKARNAAAKLNETHPGERVSGLQVDAGDGASLRAALEGIDMLVVASSTAEYAEIVVQAAIDARVDYLDVQYSTAKLKVLQAHAAGIEKDGLCFITESGFHPGLPAAMVRLAAGHFDSLESANVGSVIRIDWSGLDLSPATLREFVGEFANFQTLHFKDGRWQQMSALQMMFPVYMDFGGDFGRQYTMPMFLEEMRALPDRYPSLRETGFFVGGFNWFVDWFLSPIIMLGLKLFPKTGPDPLGRLMYWGLRVFSRPPYGTLLKLEARGRQADSPKSLEMLISHPDGYMLTAIPVAACLLQLLNEETRKPGLHFQAQFVEPKCFFEDMTRLGARVQIVEKN